MVDLAEYAAEDVEELVVAWLKPLLRAGAFRDPDDDLPFALVTHITGTESVDEGTADPIVSVHMLYPKGDGGPSFVDAALQGCKDIHDRMKRLATHAEDITLTDARVVHVDYLSVVESPRWQFYSDRILQKVGRYQIGLAYAPRTT